MEKVLKFSSHSSGVSGTWSGWACFAIIDAFLDLVQHLDSLFHILGIAHRHSAGVMDHKAK